MNPVVAALLNAWGLLCHVVVRPVFLSAVAVRRITRCDPNDEQWESQVDYGTFFLGIPALLGAVLVGGTVLITWRATDDDFVNRYAADAARALRTEDFDAAVVGLSRLCEQRPDYPDFQYRLALAYAGADEPDRAAAIMARLAPSERIGYVPAHLWTIRRRLELGPSTDEQRRIEAQLIALRGDRDLGGSAAALLAELYIRSGRTALVLGEPALRAAAEQVPPLHLAILEDESGRGLTPARRQELVPLVRGFRKNLVERTDDVEARIALSRALTLQGDLDGAVTTLREGVSVLPDGPFGRLIAQLLLSVAARTQQRSDVPAEQRTALYREALAAVERYAEPGPLTDLRRAQLYRLLNEFEPAERCYRAAVDDFPAARCELAELYAARGRQSAAYDEWQRLRDYFFRRLLNGPAPDDDERRMAALACRHVARYQEAAQWLEQPRLVDAHRPLLAAIYVDWWDSLPIAAAPAGADVEPRVDLLLRGLDAEPLNKAIVQRLLWLSRRNDRAAAEAIAAAERLVVAGPAKAAAYLLLGSVAYMRGDAVEARKYLEESRRLDPAAADTVNHLAWVLASSDPPDLKRALELADAAVELSGNDPRARDTRFRIYAKLKQWRSALRDLEACEQALSGDPDFHRAAAEVYDALGLHAPAEAHRRRATRT